MKTKENIELKKEHKSYKGISLIVLVITIIVIIILAAAIILTLNKNNPIEEANRARYESDRASMQAIFTNTVAKIMVKNQGTMEIKEGILNEVKSGASSAIGEVTYTLNNPEKSENKEGKIIFDNKENTQIEYYTGRKLPIYPAGETIWSVDNEGIINLKVGKNIYGSGEQNDDESITPPPSSESDISKEMYDNLMSKIEELENNTVKKDEFSRKTTMKTISKNAENKYIGSDITAELINIVIPEDCYANIVGSSIPSNHTGNEFNSKYCCLSISKNDVQIPIYNGGVGSMDLSISYSCELKKGDILKLCLYQQTGINAPFNSNFVVTYFPK